MSEFHIGQQVICVDDAKPKGYHPHAIPNWVVKDSEYIIRGFADNDGIVVGVWLEELVNPLVPIGLLKKFQEPAFATWRFRKGLSAFEIAEEIAPKNNTLKISNDVTTFKKIRISFYYHKFIII